MRLVCPNCEAKYEVPDDAIPDTGRDVQCTNCSHSWYQMRGRSGAAPLAAMSPAEPAKDDPSDQNAPAEVPEGIAPLAEAEQTDAELLAGLEADSDPEPVALADAGEPADTDAAPDVTLAADVEVSTDPVADGQSAVESMAESVPDTEPMTNGVAADATGPGFEGSNSVEADAASVVAVEADAISEAAPVFVNVETAVSAAPAEQTVTDLVATEAPTETAGPEKRDDETPAPAPNYAVDESVLAILREEAEREANARRAEALESQTDLGIDAAIPPKAAALVAEADAKPSARRDLLPDVEEINSTLRPSEMQAEADGTPDFAPAPPEAPRGFRSGFLTLMTIAILGAALYIVAPRLAILAPGLAEPLQSYVSMIDSLRLGLDGMMRSATVAISDD